MTSSHYDILNVPSTASLTTIKEAYRGLVKQYHPDKQSISQDRLHVHEVVTGTISDTIVQQSNLERKNSFLQIQTAWECLRDADQRRRYDAALCRQQRLHIQQRERLRTRHQNAFPIFFHECRSCCYCSIDGLVENDVIDWIYQCRCGYDLYVAQSYSSLSSKDQQVKLLPYDTDPGESIYISDTLIVQCVGCSIFYDIAPLFSSDPELPVSEADE
jgi:curved DNA-binding protein CbpA